MSPLSHCICYNVCPFMPTKILSDKLAVAVQRNGSEVFDHLILWKSGKCAKTVFYFLKTNANNSCRAAVRRKTISDCVNKGIRVFRYLHFIAEEKYINVLQENPGNLLQKFRLSIEVTDLYPVVYKTPEDISIGLKYFCSIFVSCRKSSFWSTASHRHLLL